jgi:hypothetical protein
MHETLVVVMAVTTTAEKGSGTTYLPLSSLSLLDSFVLRISLVLKYSRAGSFTDQHTHIHTYTWVERKEIIF